MRNLVFLVVLGLGISFCIYYSSNNTQDASVITQENTTENTFNGNERTTEGRMEYDLQEQDQESLNGRSTKADMTVNDLDGNDGSADIIQTDGVGNIQDPNPPTKPLTSFFGQYKLQKLMHQYHSEDCACTKPNDDRTDKKKISAPRWLQAVRRIDKN